jgi:ElaA protein
VTGAGGTLRRATFAELDTATLYALLQLRVDVFVVEQRCAYRELDGRDIEPTTQHLWIDDAGAVGAYLRLLVPDDHAGRGATTGDPEDAAGAPARIGRVVTAPPWRGRGVAQRLVRAALDMVPGPVVLDAQEHLRTWYERLGFVVCGPGFVEDGIAHVPMALDTMRWNHHDSWP